MPSILSAKHFHDEAAAHKWVEARVWPEGRICPHCKTVDRSGPLKGKSTRIGAYKCYEKECRKPFTVKVGTIFEASHIKLHIWLQAMHLIASSKKGFSSNQLSRVLGVSLKSAWFLSHRIRELMKDGDLSPFGSDGGAVEVDETYWGQDPDKVKPTGYSGDKMKVLTLIERSSGRARSMVIDDLKISTIIPIVQENVAKEARLMTDDANHYRKVGRGFAQHGRVSHGKEEYVSKDDPTIHTQTVENYYSVFKRGMKGTYQHCAKRHLHRYCAECDYRYSNRAALGVDDKTRMERLLSRVIGRRLTYRRPDEGRTGADGVEA